MKGQLVRILHGYHAGHIGTIHDVWERLKRLDVICTCVDMPEGDTLDFRFDEVEEVK